MIKLAFALALSAGVGFAVAKTKSPDLSTEAVARIFTAYGWTTGATHNIEGATYRLDKIRVESKDDWIVIHIRPKRVR